MSLKNKKILVVDDERDLVEILQTRLETLGCGVLTAFDGEEALAKARAEKPDLLLLDIMMPKLNGFQVCREMKKDEKTKAIPVIMLTAKADESSRFWGGEVGAVEYIVKPFDMDDLIQKIERQLKK